MNLDLYVNIKKYIENYKQLIIILSGFNGCNKHSISEKIASEFKLKIIDWKNYTDKPHKWKYDNIKWDKLNDDINLYKKDGIIIVTPIFPSNKMNFICDLHINYYMNKHKIAKILNMTKNKNNLSPNSIYSQYLEISKLSYFNHVIDISNIDIDDQYNNTINFIQSFLIKKETPKKNKYVCSTSVDKFINNINEFIGIDINAYNIDITKLPKTHIYSYNVYPNEPNNTNNDLGIITVFVN